MKEKPVQINAIRYRPVGSNHSKTYQFGSGLPRNKGYQLFNGTYEQAHLFNQSLLFLLNGDQNPYVQMASINISDFSGNTWIIERIKDSVQIKKNGLEISPSHLPELILSLFDTDEMPVYDRKNLTQITKITANEFCEFTKLEQHQKSTKEELLEDHINKNISLIKKNISRLVGPSDAPTSFSHSEILKGNQLQKEVSDLQIKKNQLFDQIGSAAGGLSMDSLRTQIDLLNKLKALCGEYLTPNGSPQLLRQKLSEVEDQIQKCQQTKRIGNIEDLTKGDDWNQLINLRCRLKVLSKLSQQSEQYSQICKNSLRPLLINYTKVLETVRSSDDSRSKELEKSIDDVHTTIEEMNRQASQSAFGEMISALKKGRTTSTEHHQINLEHTKEMLDYLKKHLPKIGGEISSVQTKLDKTERIFDDFSSNISEEKNKLVKSWNKKCNELKVPNDSSLNDIISMASSVGKFSDLHHSRSQLIAKLDHFQNSLPEIRRLILALRKAGNSQKMTSLDRESVIISETASELRYFDQKKAKLEKLESQMISNNDTQVAYKMVAEELSSKEQQWEAFLEKHSLPVWKINSENWRKLFEQCSQLTVLEEVKPQSHKKNNNHKINFAKLDDTTLIHLRSLHLDENIPQTTEAIENLLDGSYPGSLQIIVTDHPEIFSNLKAMGLSYAKEVKPQASSKPAPKTATMERSSSIMSPKALETIKALKATQYHS